MTSITIRAVNAAGVTVATTAPASDGSYSLTLATGVYEIVFDDGITPRISEVTLAGATPPAAPEVLDVSFEETP